MTRCVRICRDEKGAMRFETLLSLRNSGVSRGESETQKEYDTGRAKKNLPLS